MPPASTLPRALMYRSHERYRRVAQNQSSAPETMLTRRSPRRSPEAERPSGAPHAVVPVLVEVELLDAEPALEVGQLGEGAVQRGVRQVMRHRDVRVVVELQRPLERAAAHRTLQPLAAADA